MLLSPSPFGSRSASQPRNLPSSPSRLNRGYDRAPRGAQALLHDPAQLAESGSVFGATAREDRGDAQVADQGPVLVVVVAAVGVDLRRHCCIELSPRSLAVKLS